MDNYLDPLCRADTRRPSFKTRCKTFEDEKFGDGSQIFILGKEYLGGELDHFYEQLSKVARHEDPKEIFKTSVEIIRAAAANSKGCVGYNCSGVRISRNDRHIEALDSRDRSIWDAVMPDIVYSTSRISASVRNMHGRNLNP